jgi:hypothetical protein
LIVRVQFLLRLRWFLRLRRLYGFVIGLPGAQDIVGQLMVSVIVNEALAVEAILNTWQQTKRCSKIPIGRVLTNGSAPDRVLI